MSARLKNEGCQRSYIQHMVWGIQLFRFQQNISKTSSLEKQISSDRSVDVRILTAFLKLYRLFSPELLRDSKK
jgi:hypothetical protein